MFSSKRFLLFTRGIVSYLVFALIFCTAILPALSPPPLAQAAAAPSTNPVPQPVEVFEKRTASTKTFDNGDGTFTKQIYSSPAHFLSDGVWSEIDSSIMPSADGNFENTANCFKVRFAKTAKSGALTSFELNGMTVSYALIDPELSDVSPSVSENTITYENILPNIDLRQVVLSNGIKEDIVLKRYIGKNTFTFQLKTSGVEAKKEADGSIGFYHTKNNEKAFVVPKPFMVDSGADGGSRSDCVKAEVVKRGADTFISITADESWLKSPERVYPVYIDPTTNLNQSSDSYVSEQNPGQNFEADWDSGGYYRLKCGRESGYANRPFISFDTSPIAGTLVTQAKLYLYVKSAPQNYKPYWHKVDSSWTASSITWNNMPSTTQQALSENNAGQNQWVRFNVSSIVAKWASSPPQADNHGFSIRAGSESDSSYFKKFSASENSTYKPYVEVTYANVSTPTATAYGNSTNSASGYVNLSWNSVSGASGYKAFIFNGAEYESFNVGNVTTWTTSSKGICPTASEIAQGRYALHHDGQGTDLADDPSPVYTNANAGYGSYQNYWFKIKAYNGSGDETTLSAQATPTLPDRTAPPSVATPSISGTQDSTGNVSVTVSWNGANDYVTGTGYGTYHYNLELARTSLSTNTADSTSVTVAHSETGIHSYAFYNQPNDTSFQAKVITYDNNGNYSSPSSSTTWTAECAPMVNFVYPQNNDTTSGAITITGHGKDFSALKSLNVKATKYGTDDTEDLGTVNYPSGTKEATSTWNWDTAKLTDGEYVLTLNGLDTANHTGTAQINVKVENIPDGMGIDHGGMVDNNFGKVNMANGNFVVTQTDVNLSGRGLGTNITRVYNSQMKTNGDLGWGWRLDVPELSQYSNGSVLIIDGSGAKHLYTTNTDGSFKTPTGTYITLTKNSDSTFTWKFKDGRKCIFSETSETVTLEDKNGNQVVYQFNEAGKLAKITDPSGRETTFEYHGGGTGKLKKITDYGNRVWQYAYSSDNLSSVTAPLDTVTSFGYDSDHYISSITDANGGNFEFHYPNPDRTKLGWVKWDQKSRTDYTYDAANKKFTVTDPKGYVTEYRYNANWSITKVTDASGNASSYHYDANHNLIGTTIR